MDKRDEVISELRTENSELRDKVNRLESQAAYSKGNAAYWYKEHNKLYRKLHDRKETKQEGRWMTDMEKKESQELIKLAAHLTGFKVTVGKPSTTEHGSIFGVYTSDKRSHEPFWSTYYKLMEIVK